MRSIVDFRRSLKETSEEGFTLIEILVVILIIGILASIAIPVFLNQRQTANDAAVKSDVKSLAMVIQSSVTSNNPPSTKVPQITWIANKYYFCFVDTISTNCTPTTPGVQEFTLTSGVHISTSGSPNAYEICANHDNGKLYKFDATNPTYLCYNSSVGGMRN